MGCRARSPRRANEAEIAGDVQGFPLRRTSNRRDYWPIIPAIPFGSRANWKLTSNLTLPISCDGPGVQGRVSATTVDLGSLTAMRYAIAGLRCVPQSMQGVHRVIQGLLLFDVVSG
jgi:hypothetical protein